MNKLYVRKDVYEDMIEKGYGKRDYSKLSKKVITDKNGHTRTVWVKNGVKQASVQKKPATESFNKEESIKRIDDFVNSLTIDDFSVYDSQFSWPPVTKEEKYEKELNELKRNINTIKSYTPKASYSSVINALDNISYKSELRMDKANEFIRTIQHPIMRDIINNNFHKGQVVRAKVHPFNSIKEWVIEDINDGAVTIRGITDKEGESVVDMKYRSAFKDGTGWKDGKALMVMPKGGPKTTHTPMSFIESVAKGNE